ncbi:MAG: SRPBCC family protein [Dehalococcoidia bacterium]
MGSYATRVTINAPADKVWSVLSDLGSIYKWNPGISHSHSTSDEASGENATRQCDLPNGGFLRERAFNWREGEGYTIDVYETTLPLKKNHVDFRLASRGDSTVVALITDYELKYGPIGALMDALFARRQVRKGMDDLLAGLKRHIETGETVNEPAAVSVA